METGATLSLDVRLEIGDVNDSVSELDILSSPAAKSQRNSQHIRRTSTRCSPPTPAQSSRTISRNRSAARRRKAHSSSGIIPAGVWTRPTPYAGTGWGARERSAL